VALLCLLSFVLSATGKAVSALPNWQQMESPCAANGAAVVYTLEPGTILEKEIVGKDSHCFKFDLQKNDFIHILVEQKGSDVRLILFAPDGSNLFHIDRPNGSHGSEGLSLIANAGGTFSLRVSGYSESATRGSYQIRVDALRKAIPQDESRMLAERLVTEGEELREKKTAESLPLAIEKFNRALDLWRAFNDTYEQAVTLYGLGWTYSAMGENQLSINSFNASMTLMREVGNAYGNVAAQTGLAWEYLYFGETEKALRNFLQTLDVKRSLKDKRGEAISLYGIGWCSSLKGETDKALDYFFQSLRLRQEIKDANGEALTRVGIGNAYAIQEKRREALDSLNIALQYFRNQKEKKDYSGEANVLSSMGWSHLTLKEYEVAGKRFQEALELRRKAGDRLGEATTLFGIAKTKRAQGDLLAARMPMELSLELIESLRSKGTNNQLRLSYFATVQEYYEFYIDLLMQLHRADPTKGFAAAALEVSERARARTLADLLTESSADLKQGVSQQVLEREKRLRQRIGEIAYRQQTVERGTFLPDKSEALENEIALLTSQLDEVLSQIRQASPMYAAIMQPQQYKASELQREIDEDSLVLEYALGEQRSYLFAVSRKEITVYELPPRGRLEAVVSGLYQLLTAHSQDWREGKINREQLKAEYAQALMEASQLLLGQVKSLGKVKRLVVAAQGILQLLPFAVLPIRATERLQPIQGESKKARLLSKVQPLILTHEVVTIPSLSTIALLRRVLATRQSAAKALAIFADPVFDKADERVKPITGNDSAIGRADGNPLGLERLSATRWEAEQIKALVREEDSLLALDFAANRDLAMSEEIKHYRILHFATHAFINDEYPQLSEIVLSAVNQQGEAVDAAVRACDLFTIRLSADLVVLSGCKTGVGKYVRGEGVMNLTRMFMCAGVPSVVVSLWSVEDKAAAELMVRFYKKMFQKKLSPSAALREAQAEMWRDGKSRAPYLWGAFTLQGDWR
jgi:CHAT domain-containing protein/Tfp pilus assembly protein PilF